MKRSTAINLTVFAILGALLAGMLLFRQEISDLIRLYGYTPPREIIAIADATTMSDSSRRLFYVNQPLIADRDVFNEHCRDNEHTIVLGCFIDGDGIYLLDVTDERLEGIEEVTAAHELLHAVYLRLSRSERARIDLLVQEAYEKSKTARLEETISLYQKQNPDIVPNELHSILGSEVRKLPQELEDYYSRYFIDRSRIVTLAEQYEQAFTSRRNQIKEYDSQLVNLKTQINTLQDELNSEYQSLTNQRNEMNSLRNSGQIEAYNSQVPIYNQRVNNYNADYDRLQSLITKHNDIVKTRNDLAHEEAELVEAIDSRATSPGRL